MPDGGAHPRAAVLLSRAIAETLEMRRLLSGTITVNGDAGGTSVYIERSADHNSVDIFVNQPLDATPSISVPVSDNDPIVLNLNSESDNFMGATHNDSQNDLGGPLSFVSGIVYL